MLRERITQSLIKSMENGKFEDAKQHFLLLPELEQLLVQRRLCDWYEERINKVYFTLTPVEELIAQIEYDKPWLLQINQLMHSVDLESIDLQILKHPTRLMIGEGYGGLLLRSTVEKYLMYMKDKEEVVEGEVSLTQFLNKNIEGKECNYNILSMLKREDKICIGTVKYLYIFAYDVGRKEYYLMQQGIGVRGEEKLTNFALAGDSICFKYGGTCESIEDVVSILKTFKYKEVKSVVGLRDLSSVLDDLISQYSNRTLIEWVKNNADDFDCHYTLDASGDLEYLYVNSGVFRLDILRTHSGSYAIGITLLEVDDVSYLCQHPSVEVMAGKGFYPLCTTNKEGVCRLPDYMSEDLGCPSFVLDDLAIVRKEEGLATPYYINPDVAYFLREVQK